MAKIAIIGGGVMGSSIAYYLALAGAASDVIVIEADPTYEFAATPRATGGPIVHRVLEHPHGAVRARGLRPIRNPDGGRWRYRADRLEGLFIITTQLWALDWWRGYAPAQHAVEA
jgi:glycine/D-amino acid oxidase-like deaminating enzyme